MSEFLFQYEKVNPISWAYLSSLLMIALFFKFNRFWSVRNLDLILLILLAPGLLVVQAGRRDLRQVRLDKAALNQAQEKVAAEWQKLAEESAEVQHASHVVESKESGESLDKSPLASFNTSSGENESNVDESPPPVADNPEKKLPEFPRSGQALQKLADREADVTRMLWRGYASLLVVCGLLLIRLLFDPTMVRRPLLEPNMSTGGMLFLATMLFLFLMANVITSRVTVKDVSGARGAKALIGTETRTNDEIISAYRQHGPGYFILHLLPSVITPAYPADAASEGGVDPRIETPVGPVAAFPQPDAALVAVSKGMSILAHLAILAAMIFIGYWHFENIKMGIGAATLYLILPYTS
ncbi:MAG: hypothetical protein K8R36_15300, partial [Planctomycetales bacterium]|nr:hypothetical protein [Planctomycetales bacterium]